MIWRRKGCTSEVETAHDDCPGRRLAETVAAELAGATRDEIPERIMRMRNRAEAAEDPERGQDAVLLWDDPGRRPPRDLLLPPTGEPDADG
jgi:hypothetical protein